MGKCSCSGLNSDCFKCGGTGFNHNNYHIDTSRLPVPPKNKSVKKELNFTQKESLKKNKIQKVIDGISNPPLITLNELLNSPSKYYREVFIEKFNELNELIENSKKNINQIEKPNKEIILELKQQFAKIQIILSQKLHKPSPITIFLMPNEVKGSVLYKKKENKKKKNKAKAKKNKSSTSNLNNIKPSKKDPPKYISHNPTIGDLINLGMVKPIKK